MITAEAIHNLSIVLYCTTLMVAYVGETSGEHHNRQHNNPKKQP